MATENNNVTDSGRHSKRVNILLILLAFGFAVAILGMMILTIASVFSSNGSSSSSIVIFIGPFPIVFGSGPDAGWLIVISLLLVALSIIIFYLMKANEARKTV